MSCDEPAQNKLKQKFKNPIPSLYNHKLSKLKTEENL